MTEQDIAAQLDANLSAVRSAFARVNQAVDEDDPLSALLGMSDTILSVAKFADAAAKAVDLVSKERDAARAEVDRLQEAFETSAVYTAHLQVTRQDALAEVSKLQAEVAKLRACLPKWRAKYPDCWAIHDPNSGGALEVWRSIGRWYWAERGTRAQQVTCRDAAMRAAEAAAGLPQCEVCDA